MAKLVVNIDADKEARMGRFANMTFLQTKKGVSYIDFVLADMPGDNETEVTGMLVSRVFMENDVLIALRDSINEMIVDQGLADE